MDSYTIAFEAMLKNEGGYVLHEVEHDKGGVTYAGISRRYNPDWVGWHFIDLNEMETAKKKVKGFYFKRYWLPMKCDEYVTQEIVNSIFGYAVNAGVRTCTRLVQVACKTKVDGILGAKTKRAVNTIGDELFLARFTIARIAGRISAVQRDKTQIKFFYGWVSRDIKMGKYDS